MECHLAIIPILVPLGGGKPCHLIVGQILKTGWQMVKFSNREFVEFKKVLGVGTYVRGSRMLGQTSKAIY